MRHESAAGPVEILLVDDNPGDVRLTKEALKEGKVHHRLRVAVSGREALALLDRSGGDNVETLPEIILLDLNLPGMSGLEVLKELKSDERLRRIPVVILTTSGLERDICREHDAACYVMKPTDLDEFIEVVKSLESFRSGAVRLGNGSE